MKIECLIRRRTGSTVVLDGTEYKFKPQEHVPGAPHVCDVQDADHIKTLLANESFVELGNAPKAEFKPLTAPPPKVEEPEEEKPDIDSMTKAQLLKYAEAAGLRVTFDKGDSKNVILNKIRRAENGNG